MSTSKSLIDLCTTKQSVKMKKFSLDIIYKILVVIKFWQSVKRFV